MQHATDKINDSPAFMIKSVGIFPHVSIEMLIAPPVIHTHLPSFDYCPIGFNTIRMYLGTFFIYPFAFTMIHAEHSIRIVCGKFIGYYITVLFDILINKITYRRGINILHGIRYHFLNVIP